MQSGIGRRRAAALAEGDPGYAQRRSEVVAAGAQVFKAKGFHGATLTDVAQLLGTDRTSLYYYIDSKEELFHEVVRGAAEENARQAEIIRDGGEKADTKIRSLIMSLMASYARHYPYLFVYIQEDLSQVGDGRSAWSKQMRAINKRYDDAVVAIVQAGLDEGSLQPVGSARVIANGIIGMVNWSHRWYRADAAGGPSAEEIGETFVGMLLEGLSRRG